VTKSSTAKDAKDTQEEQLYRQGREGSNNKIKNNDVRSVGRF